MSVGSTGLPRRDVPAAFDVGASAYDRLVGANPEYHAHLRLSARRMRLPGRGQGLRLLDAGCGTGASTAALLRVAPQADIVAVDASRGMLKEAQAKEWPASVRFVHSPIEALAENGVVGPFDGIWPPISFAICRIPIPSCAPPPTAAAGRHAGCPRVLGARFAGC